MNRAAYRGKRLCPTCRRRNTEVGQRGDRLMHARCRRLLDSGMTTREVCDRVSDDLVLTALTVGTLSTRMLITVSGMSSATALRAARRLVAAGRVTRERWRNGEAGRTYLYRRVTTRREQAAA